MGTSVTAETPVAAVAAPAAPGTVVLRAEAKARGRWITLADVAGLDGVALDRREAVGALRIARTPMTGATRRLEAEEVMKKLAAAGLDGITVAPGAALVTAAVRALPGADLVACGRAFLEAEAGKPGVTVRIEDPAAPRVLAVPEGVLELKASTGSRRLAGLVPVAVEVWCDGERVGRQLLSYRVKATGRGLKAVRTLEPGEVLVAADVEEAELDLATAPEDVLTDPAALAGLRVVRAVGEGGWMRRGAVALALQVRRNTPVTLIAKVGTVEARAMAQSRDDGAAGEVITVVNLNSKRTLRARVAGPDLVEAVVP